MQQMASRPFATVNVALETDEEPPDLIGGNVKVSTTFLCDNPTNPRESLCFLSWQDGKHVELYPSSGVIAHRQGESSAEMTAVCDYIHDIVIHILWAICFLSLLSVNIDYARFRWTREANFSSQREKSLMMVHEGLMIPKLRLLFNFRMNPDTRADK